MPSSLSGRDTECNFRVSLSPSELVLAYTETDGKQGETDGMDLLANAEQDRFGCRIHLGFCMKTPESSMARYTSREMSLPILL